MSILFFLASDLPEQVPQSQEEAAGPLRARPAQH